MKEITRKEAVKELRSFAAYHHSIGAVRISRNGDVNFYGVMPNTNQIGWFFAGSVEDAYNRYIGHSEPVKVVG